MTAMEMIRPTYIIVCCESGSKVVDQAVRMMKYRYGLDVDKLLVSDYISVLKNGQKQYLLKNDYDSGRVDEGEIQKDIVDDILYKIAYPQDMLPIGC